jgi:two-component system sensor histidine kinase BaeS
MGRLRTRTLTGQAVLIACAVALISVAVTALTSVPIALRANQKQANEALNVEANLAAVSLRYRIDRAGVQADRIAAQLRAEGVNVYLIRNGEPDRAGLPAAIVQQVAGGQLVHGRRAMVGGRLSVVEGRSLPTADGVVLTRPIGTGTAWLVLSNLWLPLMAGLAAGVIAGSLLARRLARPIRNAATAAARLRAGDRAVRGPGEPPVEVQDLAHAINALASALATSEGRQREFLLSVSHELRTPLTTIKGYAEALADGVVASDGAQRAGQTMLAESEHLDRLVADLLTLARLEAADFALEFVEVDLTTLAMGLAEVWAARYAAVGVLLSTELPPSAPGAATPVLVCTDPGRVRQVVDGLLENALRVVPPGAPVVLAVRPPEQPASFAVLSERPAAFALLEVRDGGPGFTDEDLAVAFERGALYQRYRGVRKVGSGLGLALAARLVRRLGGQIEAGHAAEGGARFTVQLPIAGRSDPDRPGLDRGEPVSRTVELYPIRTSN